MSDLVFFLALGLAFLGLLILWLQRARESPVSQSKLSETAETLKAIQLEPLPRESLEKIFALQDWEFVLEQAPLHIQRAFRHRRTTVALEWLRQTRARARRLMELHRRAVRGNVHLSPATEIHLTFSYIVFLLLCSMMHLLIWSGGPFWLRRTVTYTAVLAEQLYYRFGRLLIGFDPADLSKIRAS